MASDSEMPPDTTPKPHEDKRDRFVRLADNRTKNAIKSIRTIAKLGNKVYYEYEERDVRKIVSALNREIEALQIRMTSSGSKDIIDF